MKVERRVKEGSWLPTRYAPTSYTYSPISGSAHLKPDMKLRFLNSIFLTPFQRESVANSAAPAGREADVANAADLPMEEDDGWFKISPFGTFNGRVPGRPQYFGEPQAKAIEEEFNSVYGRVKRWGQGVPIYRGHPDVDPEVWPDDRRIGKITRLETRTDGLWGFAEWNSLGLENKEQEFWIYPSPRWDAPQGKARFEPDRLISIGLTNTPRIKESEPIFNSDEPPTKDTTIMDRTALCQTLGLPPEATDDEILAKIAALQSAAADAETATTMANTEKDTALTNMAEEKRLKEEAENSLTAVRTEAATLRAAHDKLLLDGAVRSGRITGAERKGIELRLAGDQREQTINSLGEARPRLNTTGLQMESRRDERKATDNVREEVLNSIATAKAGGMKHDDAWAAAKKNPAFASYFEKSGV